MSSSQHNLSAIEARQILSFCLPGSRVEVAEGAEGCSIRITLSDEADRAVRAFGAPTFAEALRSAAEAGAVRAECIERQIAFVTSKQPAALRTSPAQLVKPESGREPAPVALVHYRGLSEFRYQIRKFVGFSERAARAAGLEPPQHQLLLAVKGLAPPRRPTIETLIERMCLDRDEGEALIASLIERSLVRWTSSPGERLLALTSDGDAVLRGLTERHREQMRSVGPILVQALGMILSRDEEAEPPANE